jgi:hypothetical protein
MSLTRLLKPISHTRELLLYCTSKKVTSKLHKLTNYKSNYTSTVYMKVNTSLCMGMQANGKKMTRWFLSRGSHVCQHASPRCVDRPLGGSAANRCFTNLSHTLGAARTYSKSEGSSMTRSTRVALRGSRGVSTMPLTIASPEHCTIFSRASQRRPQHPSLLGDGNHQE